MPETKPPEPAGRVAYDRAWFHDRFRTILNGWYRILEETSDSFAVWQPKNGVVLQSFVSKSGIQCDGVPRMMPALAAWAACRDNGPVIALDDGREIDPREILFKAFINGADPDHRDFWKRVPARNQRQVESSIVAWSLWLSRDWLVPRLSNKQIQNIQEWLASCTARTDHFNNWSLFTATNHAARLALRDSGFDGSIEEIRRDLIPGDELYIGDGWMYDKKYSNIDYYNFWVFGSHHCYLRAMLPDYENPMLDRALRELSLRLRDLPYLIGADGRNVLFGRSLPYRWGWLTGLIVAHFIGIPAPDPGLSRAMLARNIDAWLGIGCLDEEGAVREKLSPDGSEGGSSTYINCGHPYWGMQALLCLALPDAHPFWDSPEKRFPVEESDFLTPRQGPGFVFQGFRDSGEVRLYSLRNSHHQGSALYDKFVYSSAFPCNSGTARHHTAWDNQFALRLPDGTSAEPADILEVDTNDGRTLRTIRRFTLDAPGKFDATVHTHIVIEGTAYTTRHEVEVHECEMENLQWVEGGFPLGFGTTDSVETGGDRQRQWARLADGRRDIATESIQGWQTLHEPGRWKALWPRYEEEANIIHARSVHCLLTAPILAGRTVLSARHRAVTRP